jgi:hypothetical protein
MAEKMEKKRGRPRIHKTPPSASGAQVEPVIESSAAAPFPVQLTIASYGKKPKVESSEPERVHTTKVRAKKKGTAAKQQAQKETSIGNVSIVISLPVTNAMEDKFHTQHTLDDELTTYRPDIVDTPVPQSIVSSVVGHAAVFTANPGSQPLSVGRCVECSMQPFPCDTCVKKFDLTNQRSFQEYQAVREIDDKRLLGKKDEKAFQTFNEKVNDKPLPPQTFRVPEYVPSLLSDVQSLTDLTIEPYEQTAIGAVTYTGAADLQEQLLSPKVQENQDDLIERLKAKVAFFESQLRNRPSINRNQQGDHECLWHLDKFATQPIGLPVHYDEQSGTYETVGCFCSFQCMYAYRLEHRSAEYAPLNLLFQAYKDAYKEQYPGVAIPKLVPAPPRQALKRFGGLMDLEDFLKTSTGWHILTRNPWMPNMEYVEASDVGKKIEPHNSILHSQLAEEADQQTQLLRKREKPHPNAANQWENAVRRTRVRKQQQHKE